MLLPFLTLLLRTRGFRYTQRFLQKHLAPPKEFASVAAGDSLVALTSRMVLAAARNSPMRSTCLERSLALGWLLARQGIATRLRIGVRKDHEKFAAHAWLELGTVAIGESDASHLHYSAFAEEMRGDLP